MQLNWNQYRPSKDTTVLTTIDAHAAGEPLRIITSGLPDLPGSTMLEKRRYMQQNYDAIRRALMWEPRGHHEMYGCVLTPSVTPEADLGVLFMHNEDYSTMCGHGVIALVTTLLNTGALPAKGQLTPVNLDTPAGLVRATAHLDSKGQVEHVSFLNVASFLYARDVEVTVPDFGKVLVDIAFGGAFYAYLPAERIGLSVVPEQLAQLVAAGEAIKKAVNVTLPVKHPLEEDLSFLYGTILIGPPADPAHHSRNICVFANAEVDRSPTGTGVSGRLAIHHAKGELVEGQQIVIESILMQYPKPDQKQHTGPTGTPRTLEYTGKPKMSMERAQGAGSTFSGRVVGRTKIGSYDAVIPEVSGTAFITGRHEFLIDPRDEIGKGFLLSSS